MFRPRAMEDARPQQVEVRPYVRLPLNRLQPVVGCVAGIAPRL
jgi:hypothetical protein